MHTTHDDILTVGSKHANNSRERTHSRPRPRSANLKTSPYARSASFPNNLSSVTTSPSSGPSDPFTDQQSLGHSSTNASDYPQYHTTTVKSPRPIHAHTEPTPFRQLATQLEFPHALVLSGLENASISDQKSLAQVLTEKQIVLDEHTREVDRHDLENKKGKTTALDNSVIFDDAESSGIWNAPDEFITIYVCPWNAQERPDIHKTLVIFCLSDR